MKVLAVDIGFGYTKATDGRQFQVFKSVLGEANPAQFSDVLAGTTQSGLPQHFTLGDDSYFVGDLAERESRGRNFTLDPQQFLSKHAKQLAIAALAPLAPDGEPVRVITGLPISFFRRYKDALAALLKGRHSVGFTAANGQVTTRQLYIEQVRVIPQPFGSMFNLMLNDLGKPASQRFISEKVGIVDVGFRTADYTISDKTRYTERGSASTDSGMSVAYAQVAAFLQEKSGMSIELFRLYDAFRRGSIKIKGKVYDVKPIVNEACERLAQKIATEVNRQWADDWDIDSIVITGGGGQALHAHLAPLLEGEVLPAVENGDARVNNVTGYFKYGVHLWGDGDTTATATATATPGA